MQTITCEHTQFRITNENTELIIIIFILRDEQNYRPFEFYLIIFSFPSV